mmetsp:Transcript_30574/g.72351  ORF Transcript_30574/g.72351 Transcript_30574/m.72351 type:complete len:208 (-) Transcript_30574:730-1353(-)
MRFATTVTAFESFVSASRRIPWKSRICLRVSRRVRQRISSICSTLTPRASSTSAASSLVFLGMMSGSLSICAGLNTCTRVTSPPLEEVRLLCTLITSPTKTGKMVLTAEPPCRHSSSATISSRSTWSTSASSDMELSWPMLPVWLDFHDSSGTNTMLCASPRRKLSFQRSPSGRHSSSRNTLTFGCVSLSLFPTVDPFTPAVFSPWK